MNHFLAIDIGAESGRLILGTLNDRHLTLNEIHRFRNGMVRINGHDHWNIVSLYSEILNGISICVHEKGIIPDSIGIDTWGVDYGLLAEDGSLMGLPFAYRDERTIGAIDAFCDIYPKSKIYHHTGNLFASYNTLFQLFAAKKQHPALLNSASALLFIPDLLAYFLTGIKKTEFSFATTTQLFNREQQTWDKELLHILGVNPDLMQEIVPAGTLLGPLNETVCSKIRVPAIPIMAVATHDTASAIASLPASSSQWAFISSGTWSLMGIETEKAIINNRTYALNLSNEGGWPGCNYLLKNLMGLWVLQQSRQSYLRSGQDLDYTQLIQMAASASPFLAVLDVDHPAFLNPQDMNQAIRQYCQDTLQQIPEDPGQTTRVILESLALKYRKTFLELSEFQEIREILITGGGIHNHLLCQFTANACALPVKATLAEGTATGNILAQAIGRGIIPDLAAGRAIIGENCHPVTYIPEAAPQWEAAYHRFLQLPENK